MARALRQVLKTAVRLGWLSHVPDLSAPYKASGKVSHRGWFSPEEYRTLYTATRNRALKYQGTPRGTAAARVHDYSLRHTYICFRLLEGADIYQVAKNCRTSVDMIEKYYAAHIRTSLNAAAINVRRSNPNAQRAKEATAAPN